jgi:hypothetical protein
VGRKTAINGYNLIDHVWVTSQFCTLSIGHVCWDSNKWWWRSQIIVYQFVVIVIGSSSSPIPGSHSYTPPAVPIIVQFRPIIDLIQKFDYPNQLWTATILSIPLMSSLTVEMRLYLRSRLLVPKCHTPSSQVNLSGFLKARTPSPRGEMVLKGLMARLVHAR